jgi:hypothetical protein
MALAMWIHKPWGYLSYGNLSLSNIHMYIYIYMYNMLRYITISQANLWHMTMASPKWDHWDWALFRPEVFKHHNNSQITISVYQSLKVICVPWNILQFSLYKYIYIYIYVYMYIFIRIKLFYIYPYLSSSILISFNIRFHPTRNSQTWNGSNGSVDADRPVTKPGSGTGTIRGHPRQTSLSTGPTSTHPCPSASGRGFAWSAEKWIA